MDQIYEEFRHIEEIVKVASGLQSDLNSKFENITDKFELLQNPENASLLNNLEKFRLIHCNITDVLQANFNGCQKQTILTITNNISTFSMQKKVTQTGTLKEIITEVKQILQKKLEIIQENICGLKTILKSYKGEKLSLKIKIRQEKYYKAINTCKEKVRKLTQYKTDPNKIYIISKQEQYEEETAQMMSKVKQKKESLRMLQNKDLEYKNDFIKHFESLCHDQIVPFEFMVSTIIKNLDQTLVQTKKMSTVMIGNTMTNHINEFKKMDQQNLESINQKQGENQQEREIDEIKALAESLSSESCLDLQGIDQLNKQISRTLLEVQCQRQMMFTQTGDLVSSLASFIQGGLEELQKLQNQESVKEFKFQISKLSEVERSEHHAKWFDFTKGKLSRKIENREQFDKNLKNFYAMVQKSHQGFSILHEITLREMNFFKEDMTNVFKVLNEIFRDTSESNFKEHKGKIAQLIKEAQIFIQKVDLRKNDYVQTMISNLEAYLTNIDTLLWAQTDQAQCPEPPDLDMTLEAVQLCFKNEAQLEDLAKLYQIQKQKQQNNMEHHYFNHNSQPNSASRTRSSFPEYRQQYESAQKRTASRPGISQDANAPNRQSQVQTQIQSAYVMDPRIFQHQAAINAQGQYYAQSFPQQPRYSLNRQVPIDYGDQQMISINQHQYFNPSLLQEPQPPYIAQHYTQSIQSSKQNNKHNQKEALSTSKFENKQSLAELESLDSSKIQNVKLSQEQMKKIEALRNNSFIENQRTGVQMEIRLDTDDSEGRSSPSHSLREKLNPKIRASNLEGNLSQAHEHQIHTQKIHHSQKQLRYSQPQLPLRMSMPQQVIAGEQVDPFVVAQHQGFPIAQLQQPRSIDVHAPGSIRGAHETFNPHLQQQPYIVDHYAQIPHHGQTARMEVSPQAPPFEENAQEYSHNVQAAPRSRSKSYAIKKEKEDKSVIIVKCKQDSIGEEQQRYEEEEKKIGDDVRSLKRGNRSTQHRKNRAQHGRTASGYCETEKQRGKYDFERKERAEPAQAAFDESAAASSNSFDIDSNRFNKSLRREESKPHPAQELNLDLISPRTRFIYQQFSNKGGKDGENDPEYATNHGNHFAEGEQIKDVYSCAIQQRILLQGKLYVSNQALYFHSVFNDKLLVIGRQTRIKVPLRNIKQILKKSNAIIFDNSIEVQLKTGSNLFFTSFLSRDECFRLILKMMKKIKSSDERKLQITAQASAEKPQAGPQTGPVPARKLIEYRQPLELDVQRSHAEDSDPSQRDDLQVDVAPSPSATNRKQKESNEEQKQQDEPQQNNNEVDIQSIDLWAASNFEMTDQLKELEEKRLAQIEDLIPKHKTLGWTWDLCEFEVNASLKFLMKNWLYPEGTKYSAFDDLCLWELVNSKYDNHSFSFNIKYAGGNENAALKYFFDRTKSVPTEEEVKNWPLSDQVFEASFTHQIVNPMPLAPKVTQHTEKNTDYYVSPRKFIRYLENQGVGFQFASNFQSQILHTLTQVGPNRTHVKIQSRCEILKSIMFVQGRLVAECERSCRACYESILRPLLGETVAKAQLEHDTALRQEMGKKANQKQNQAKPSQSKRHRESQENNSSNTRSPHLKQTELNQQLKGDQPVANASPSKSMAGEGNGSILKIQTGNSISQFKSGITSNQTANQSIANELQGLRAELSELKNLFKAFFLMTLVLQIMQIYRGK